MLPIGIGNRGESCLHLVTINATHCDSIVYWLTHWKQELCPGLARLAMNFPIGGLALQSSSR